MYDDPIKLFLEVQLKKIPYMERVDTDTFHDVMFNFKQETCDKSTYIFKEGETSNGLFLVKSGIIERLVRVEGFELAIERLYRGSIINHNAFLIGDVCDISARCIDTQTLFYLSYETMDRIRMKHPQLSNSVDSLRKKTAVNKNPYIIDYIMGKRVVKSNRDPKLEEKRAMLTAKLKNLIMILLARVKAQKNQSSFKEVLSGIILRKKDEIQKERKLKLMQDTNKATGGDTGGSSSDLVDQGLSKEQATSIIDLLN
jgi:hypothetical protein